MKIRNTMRRRMAFLLADQNLDCKPYNETWTGVTWETCTLRSWLNGYGADSNVCGKDYSTDNFIDAAFSQSEQSAIRETSVINDDNPEYGTEGGNNTQDKVYLLSIAEAGNAAYGFNATFNAGSDTRVSNNTAHVKEVNYSSIEDIYGLPDGERAELIDGRIYYMAPPNRTHQRISGKLHQSIVNYIDSKNGECEVYAAPFAVFLNRDDTNYVEPDISVICDISKLDEKGCHGAPDWVIEIVTSNSESRDYMAKLFKYRSAGVREYWIVDPERQTVMAYGFEKDTVEQYSFGEEVPVGIYGDFSVTV